MTELCDTLAWILEKLNPLWKLLLHPSAHLNINPLFYHQSIAFLDNHIPSRKTSTAIPLAPRRNAYGRYYFFEGICPVYLCFTYVDQSPPIQYSNRGQKQNKFHGQYASDRYRSHSQKPGYFVLGLWNTAEILLRRAKSIMLLKTKREDK